MDAKLTQVPGIGPATAKSIAKAGIRTAGELADASETVVQDATGAEPWRVEDWIEDATELIESLKGGSDETTKPQSEGSASARASSSQSGSREAPIPDPDDEFEAMWASLSDAQKKFCREYTFCATKAEAAREIGLKPSTIYSWPDVVDEVTSRLVDRQRAGLEEGINALSNDALDVLRRALDPAQEVSRVEKESAEYLLNRAAGKPTQKQEVDVQGGISLDETDEQELDAMLGHLDEDE